jgi:hypothetical protein
MTTRATIIASALLVFSVSVLAAEGRSQDRAQDQHVALADTASEKMPTDSPSKKAPESDEDC